MAAPKGPGDFLKDIQERVEFVLNADKQVHEVVDVLKDTHRILAKLESVVDRINNAAESVGDIDTERIARLEQAVFNIERATVSLEGQMAALPRRWQKRVERARAEGR